MRRDGAGDGHIVSERIGFVSHHVGPRATASAAPLMLYAFAAVPSSGSLKQLYSGAAGTWPNLGGNANIVPVVANGKVYVAAYKTLMIFGPNAPAAVSAPAAPGPAASGAELHSRPRFRSMRRNG